MGGRLPDRDSTSDSENRGFRRIEAMPRVWVYGGDPGKLRRKQKHVPRMIACPLAVQ